VCGLYRAPAICTDKRKAPMKEVIAGLLKCQEHDVTIFKLKEKLQEIPVKIAGLQEGFETEKAALLKLEDHLKTTKVKLNDKETDLKSNEEKIKKHEGQLMQIKTNKEYSALQGEIALLKKGCEEIEEGIIVTLDEIAEIEGEIQTEKKRLDGKKAELDKEKSDFEATEKIDRAKIDTLTKEREELLSPVEKSTRMLYEKIAKKRDGSALAEIDGENCGGCSMKIRPQIINEVRMCDQVVMCENCTRILYVKPGE